MRSLWHAPRGGTIAGKKCTAKGRHVQAATAESLEPRLLMSGSVETSVVDILWAGERTQAIANEWVVQFSSIDVKTDAIESQLRGSGFVDAEVENLGGGFGVLRSSSAAFEQLQSWTSYSQEVVYIEPNFVHASADVVVDSTVPNDPAYGSLWGLNNIGQSGGTADADIDAPEAWDLTTGSDDVVIAVIDTGIDYTHADLAGNMWTNPGEIVGDGIDNDGNGYVDDIYGWDFAYGDSDPMDGNGHGTHVGGTIGATGDNGSGVVGVNWNVKLMAMKFLSDSGSGTTSSAIMAINYVTMMKRDYGVNIVATNNSWGGGGYSTTLRNAIAASGEQGILFIAAAGNDGTSNESSPHYPSNYNLDNVISVAATDRNDQLASFSNYGATSVDLAAPGVSILSTVDGGGYASYSGTSMATPHVAGVVGLMAAYNPNATAAEIKSAIMDSVDPLQNLNGLMVSGGRLNAYGALQALGSGEDLAGPRVQSLSVGDLSLPVSEITITFNEDILPASLTSDSFSLMSSGVDGVFGTGDDVEIALQNSQISQPAADRVRLSLTENLSAGTYRLTVKGTGASPILDLNGNALNDGADTTRGFEVVDPGEGGEPNDTLSGATETDLVGIGQAVLAGRIGDGANLYRDVDFYRLQAQAGTTLTIDVKAQRIGSTLDSALRLFDANGVELTFNTDRIGQDSYLTHDVTETGVYFIGISGDGNISYQPTEAGSGRNASTGLYQLTITASETPEYTGPVVGMDAMGYTATQAAFNFEDIKASGNVGMRPYADDSAMSLTSQQLAGFDFEIYRNDWTTLYVATNGLITFGSPNTSYVNASLQTDPQQMAIAPFWDDLVVSGSASIIWELRGSGDNQRLIVQWDDVRFYGDYSGQTITFQAILYEADDSIRFNYLDLSTTVPGLSEGASATVGIKNAGAQYVGGDMLRISYNTSNNVLVGSQQSIRINLQEQKVDLVSRVAGVYLPPIALPGDRGWVVWDLANVGNLDALGKVDVRIYLSTDGVLDEGSDVLVGSLLNRSINLKPLSLMRVASRVLLPRNLGPGVYNILVDVDASEVAGQTDDIAVAVGSTPIQVVWRFGNFRGRGNEKLIVTDANGNDVALGLWGGGWGEVVGAENFDQINLHGTSGSSSFVMATRRNVPVTVGNFVVAGSLRNLIARSVTLTGNLTVTGSVRGLWLDNIQAANNGQNYLSINTLGQASASDTVTMRFNEVSDASIDTNGLGINALLVTRWTDNNGYRDEIRAAGIGRLLSIGNRSQGTRGDFDADLSLTGRDRRNVSLGGMYVAGSVRSSLSAQGAVGSIFAFSWNSGVISAWSLQQLRITGYQEDPGDFSADLHLTGHGLNGRTPTLNRALIRGDLSSRVWDVNGSIGLLRVGGTIGSISRTMIRSTSDIGVIDAGALDNVDILAGATRPADGAQFQASNIHNTSSIIRKLQVRGIAGESGNFVTNSTVAAGSIGVVDLTNVDFDSDNHIFTLRNEKGNSVGLVRYRDTRTGQRWILRGTSLDSDELSPWISFL